MLTSDSNMAEKSRQCQICLRTFFNPSGVRAHVKYFHEKVTFQCEKCFKNFSTNSHMRAHVRNIHEKNVQYPCDRCSKLFSSSSSKNGVYPNCEMAR